MKYGKIFAILIVNIMIISGMSAIAGAGFFSKFSSLNEVEKEGTMKLLKYSPSNKELYVIEVNNPVTSNLKIKGYFPINLDEFGEDFKKDGLKVLFTGVIHFPSIISEKGIPAFIRGYVPIRLTSIKEIQEEPEPELEFDISLESFVPTGVAIPVQASLKNVGNCAVIIDEMSPVVSTLDLLIETPDDLTIHYIGYRERRRAPDRVELLPGEKIVYNFEDITIEGMFGNEEFESYRFITGDYTIEGRYDTKIECVYDGAEKSKEIFITYVTEKYRFKISDDIPETVTLILATDPRSIPNDVFTYTEPVSIQAILDGRIHLVYTIGTEVTISVEESVEDYIFEKFSVDVSSKETEVTIIMDSDKIVIAHYKLDGPDPEPPIACFNYEPERPIVGQEISFDSSCSSIAETIIAYKWDFGDGITSEEKNPTHIYETSGEYLVTLVVSDSNGLSGSRSESIFVKENELSDTGRIFGIVRKQSDVEVNDKEPLSEVEIEVYSTGRTKGETYHTKTNGEGFYELSEVKIGEYRVVASKEGYKTASDVVLVEKDTDNEVNFILEEIGPNLELSVSIQNEIFSDVNPLRITTTINNNGESKVSVSEMGLEYNTLIIQIKTPDGKVLTTKTSSATRLPPKVDIAAHGSYSENVELSVDDFVILSLSGEGETYSFIPGTYRLTAIYHSWGPRDGRYIGRLVSEPQTLNYFEIDG